MSEFTERQLEIIKAATDRIDKYGIQNLTIKNLAADIGISEPALYRHFESKNEILFNVLEYFYGEMSNRISNIIIVKKNTASDTLRAIFNSQLQMISKNPAIVSVIFAESIFRFNEKLSAKVADIMDLMHEAVNQNIKFGQETGQYKNMLNSNILTSIVVGSVRFSVLKWKLSGHKSDLVDDGQQIVNGILFMLENSNN